MPSTTTSHVTSESLLSRIARFIDAIYRGLDFLAPIGFVLLRCWVGWQFFKSGLTKLPIENAIFLFENEYNVPILPPALAAYLATAAELALPVLLALGLAGRVSALGLFILNFVAVISYEFASLNDHLPWGLILLVFVLYGPGKLSVDHLIDKLVKR